MTPIHLPELRDDFEPTRASLHAYARAIAVVPRAHGVAHPKLWHVSLKPRPEGLVTDPVPLPDGGSVAFALDAVRHEAVMRCSDGWERRWDLRSGMTGSELGDAVTGVAAERGLEGGYERERYQDNAPRRYDADAAAAYFGAFTAVHGILERHRAGLGDRVGPIQVWPHGFDMALEWFGTHHYEKGGERRPAQLSLGFDPGSSRYFYSNPWPFEESLVDAPLPDGAVWHTEGWQGSMLPYDTVRAGDPAAIVAQYARAVFELAAPALGRR